MNLDFTPTFTPHLLRKDLDLGLAAGHDLDVPMPVAATTRRLVQALIGHGFTDVDFAALIEQTARAGNRARVRGRPGRRRAGAERPARAGRWRDGPRTDLRAGPRRRAGARRAALTGGCCSSASSRTQMHRLFLKGEVHGTTHLCAGQEAVPVGVCVALEADDYVAGTYRGHGHALAKGTDPEALLDGDARPRDRRLRRPRRAR